MVGFAISCLTKVRLGASGKMPSQSNQAKMRGTKYEPSGSIKLAHLVAKECQDMSEYTFIL